MRQAGGVLHPRGGQRGVGKLGTSNCNPKEAFYALVKLWTKEAPEPRKAGAVQGFWQSGQCRLRSRTSRGLSARQREALKQMDKLKVEIRELSIPWTFRAGFPGGDWKIRRLGWESRLGVILELGQGQALFGGYPER